MLKLTLSTPNLTQLSYLVIRIWSNLQCHRRTGWAQDQKQILGEPKKDFQKY
jgi:hypothetical protein